MPIRVLSFDIDGCLHNSSYYENYKNYDVKQDNSEELIIVSDQDLLDGLSMKEPIIHNNLKLLDSLKSSSVLYDQSIVFLGSNRQSQGLDVFNTNKNGGELCFGTIQKVAIYLDAYLDRFLMADVVRDIPEGTSFTRALNHSLENHPSIPGTDESKVTLLYTQIHKVAQENPSKEIVFHFYDDNEGILAKLKRALTKEWIPKNVTVSLYQYNGSAPILYKDEEIQGEGIIDANYRKTVKDIRKQAKKLTEIKWGALIGAMEQNETLKLNRIAFTAAKGAISCSTQKEEVEPSCLKELPTDFLNQLIDMKDEAVKLIDDQNVWDALNEIFYQIIRTYQQYERDGDSKPFENCIREIEKKHRLVENYYDKDNEVDNIILGVTTLGLGILAKGIVNYCVTDRPFLFFHPSTVSKKLDVFQTKINELDKAPVLSPVSSHSIHKNSEEFEIEPTFSLWVSPEGGTKT